MTELQERRSGGAVGEGAWDRFAAAWESGDFSGVDELFSERLVYHVPPFADMDKQGFRQFVEAFRQGFHDFRAYPLEEFADDSRSLHRWRVEGVLAGKTHLLPVETTGQATSAEGMVLFHWEAGRVVEAWHSGDWLGWLTKAPECCRRSSSGC